MSKYGTIPAAASSSTLTPEGSSTAPALDVTCRANVPGSCAAEARPWRELADPSVLSLSVPGSFTDANHRARANLAHFADVYKLVFLVVLSVVSLLLWWPRPVHFRELLSIVLPAFFVMWVFTALMPLMLFLLVQSGATTSVLVSVVAVGLLLVLPHAVLNLPADRVDEEAGRGLHD